MLPGGWARDGLQGPPPQATAPPADPGGPPPGGCPHAVGPYTRAMARIHVETVIDASPGEVWASLEDVATHVEWMADAEAIRFLGPSRSGVGTRFECDTKVGPLRLTDVMEITEWEPGATMGVRHAGLVTGTGRFTLADAGAGRTRFTWAEELRFPWWMGGPVGGAVGKPLLRRIWVGNLRRLKARVEGTADTPSG